jgi:ABC-type polysaccharide/polyol phosphate transport system ATPase subunit
MMRDTETVLEVDGLGKIYARNPTTSRRRLGRVLAQTLMRRGLAPVADLAPGEFWALKDVGFSLKRGEAIGIIGRNGSGKTSLLRILSGQLLPDAGEVRIAGRTAAMIDLTAGFQMGASGRENILLRGAMLGRGRDEMEAASDEIIAFTELGDAIDAPVMSYSSGMMMRLAFAIMVASTPDILFIDEILAVGDFRFRQKCLAKIREMRERAAFVLVSHNLSEVKLFCSSVIVLSKGQIAFMGEPEKAITFYEAMQEAPEPAPETHRAAILGPTFQNNEAVTDVEHFWADADGKPITQIQSGKTLYFRVAFTSNISTRDLILGVPVWSDKDVYATGFSTEFSDQKFEARKGERHKFLLEVPNLPLNPGTYLSNLAISNGVEFLYRQPNPPLVVLTARARNFGTFHHPHTWRPLR